MAVQKPARYIGGEQGAQQPVHGPGAGRLAAPLPRHLRDRAAEPGAADPLRDAQRATRRRGRAGLRPLGRHGGRHAGGRRAAVLGREPPAGPGVRRARLQPVGRARLHERAQPDRPGRGAAARRPSARPADPLVVAGGHCTYNPEPLADFVDAFVLGDGEEVVGEITDVLAPWLARRGRRARSRRDAPRRPGRASTGSTSRASTARATTDGRLVATDARVRRRPRAWSRSGRSPTWPTGRTPSSQLVPLTEVVHDRLNVEVFRGCTRGCRFCQAGMITRPVRERPAAQVRQMVARRPRADRLRRGRAHVALDGRLLGHRGRRSRDIIDDPAPRRAGVASACPACGSTPSPSAPPPRSSGCGAPG